jgi:alpha-beta hydrolase superfamily lysophospholipase
MAEGGLQGNGETMRTKRDPIPDSATRLHFIAARDHGISLGILERRGPAPDGRFPPVLLVHGATFGVALFDLPVPGYSLIAELALAGRTIYALDIRGYGHSLNGEVMNAPPQAHPPFARLADAVRDVESAVAFIVAREQAQAVDLVGFSWGTVVAACYATISPHRVGRLALYAPLYAEVNDIWRARIGDPGDRCRIDPAIGAYRFVTRADVIQRWDNDIGPGDIDARRDRDLPDVIFATFAALDPESGRHKPPAFRSPTGALADLVSVFNGQPLYDPARITMPTLLVRGADDTTSTDSDSKRLLDAIASPNKAYRVIAPGSHFLCVEKNRAQLYECLRRFLDGGGDR